MADTIVTTACILIIFLTPFGRYRFRRLAFGLYSAPDIFQKQITNVLGGIDGVICHLDDVTIHGKTLQEHDLRLEKVLRKLLEAGWTLNPEKCEFRKTSLSLLGHVVFNNEIVSDKSKIRAIQDLPPPKNVTELKRFLGMGIFFDSLYVILLQ